MKRWMLAPAIALAILIGASAVEPSVPSSSDLTFEIFKDARKEYRWRLRAGNGKVIAMADEGYTRKDACQHAIEIIKDGAAKAKVEDKSTGE